MTAYTLIQDFHDDDQVFRVGCKPLNINSVDAAYGNRSRVIPVAAAHLTREIPQDYCRSDGGIDPSRSASNASMLEDVPMRAAAINERAIALMEQHGIDWRNLPKNRIMAVETIISPPPGFAGDLDAFLADGLYWTEHTAFGHQVPIIAAVIHRDEAIEHLHVLALPITADGRMDGHELVGFTGKHRNRNESFYKHVGKRYGLGKPTQKVALNKADRDQLADRLLAKFAADCPAWSSNPGAMKEMRKMFRADPLGMAKAHGIALPPADQAAHQGDGSAYMRSPDVVALPDQEIDRMPVNAVAAGRMPAGGLDAAGGDDHGEVIDPAAGSGQMVVPTAPIRIETGAGSLNESVSDGRTVVREDALLAASRDAELGEHVAPPPMPSKRAQVLLGVRATAGARPRPQKPVLLDAARGDSETPAHITRIAARIALDEEADVRRMLLDLVSSGRLQVDGAIRPGA